MKSLLLHDLGMELEPMPLADVVRALVIGVKESEVEEIQAQSLIQNNLSYQGVKVWELY